MVLLILSAGIVCGQQQISVQVANEQEEGLSEALILVLKSDNNAFVRSVVVDDNGQASVHVDASREYVKIMASGYQDYDVRTFDSETLRVKLQTLSVDLGEVTIMASSRVVQKSDRIAFTAINENLTKGRNTHELLKFTPMLQTDRSDRVGIVGKDGVQLYINGRRTTMDENEIHAYLSTLPADRIASIEVITNPGASMRTSGNQGVINLILKKNEANGLNGSLMLQDLQGRLNSQSAGLFLNYQKDKLNVTANLSGTFLNLKNSEVSDFYFHESSLHQNLENEHKLMHRNMSGVIRADYNLSNKQALSMAYSASYLNLAINRNDIMRFGLIGEDVVDLILESESRSKTPTVNQSLNLNYRLKTSDRGNLSLDFYYLNNNRKQTVDNKIGQSYMIPAEEYRQHSEDPMSSFSGKAEYTHLVGQGNSLTFGAEAYQVAAESDFFYGYKSGDYYEGDPSKSNSFSYNELYSRAYLSFSRAWNQKLSSRVELIGEFVENKGLQRTTSEEVEKRGFDILPNVSLMYQHNPNHRFSYNLSSSVSRPGFYSLNPYQFYLTPIIYREYNPNLKPARLYINALNYTLKGRYTFVLDYMYIDDCMNNFLVPVDDQYTKLINANYGTLQTTSLRFNWNQSFWKNRLSLNTSLSGSYREDKGAVETIVIDSNDFFYSASANTNIRLTTKFNWNLTSNFVYASKMKLAHEDLSDFYSLTLGMRMIFNNNLSLTLGVQNLLVKHPTRDKVNENYEYFTSTNSDMRLAYVGLTFPFGNMKARGASNRNTSSQVNNRLKE